MIVRLLPNFFIDGDKSKNSSQKPINKPVLLLYCGPIQLKNDFMARNKNPLMIHIHQWLIQ